MEKIIERLTKSIDELTKSIKGQAYQLVLRYETTLKEFETSMEQRRIIEDLKELLSK